MFFSPAKIGPFSSVTEKVMDEMINVIRLLKIMDYNHLETNGLISTIRLYKTFINCKTLLYFLQASSRSCYS